MYIICVIGQLNVHLRQIWWCVLVSWIPDHSFVNIVFMFDNVGVQHYVYG